VRSTEIRIAYSFPGGNVEKKDHQNLTPVLKGLLESQAQLALKGTRQTDLSRVRKLTSATPCGLRDIVGMYKTVRWGYTINSPKES